MMRAVGFAVLLLLSALLVSCEGAAPGYSSVAGSTSTLSQEADALSSDDGTESNADKEESKTETASEVREATIRVVDADTGRPIEGARIDVDGEEVGKTNEEGTFVLQDSHPTSALVTVEASDHIPFRTVYSLLSERTGPIELLAKDSAQVPPVPPG